MMDLSKLHEPFPAADVEWRLQTAGKKGAGFWARALAYVTNRAIMERLDEVCGPENWRNEFVGGPLGGVLCGISIRIDNGWVTKWDGAENTDIEAVKGGLSGAMKRAAVQWGIGRYLYNLEEGWATCYADERQGAFHGQTKDKDRFSWDPPTLPAWALPGGSGKPSAAPAKKAAPAETKPDNKQANIMTGRALMIEAEGMGLHEHTDPKIRNGIAGLRKALDAGDHPTVVKGLGWLRDIIQLAKADDKLAGVA